MRIIISNSIHDEQNRMKAWL